MSRPPIRYLVTAATLVALFADLLWPVAVAIFLCCVAGASAGEIKLIRASSPDSALYGEVREQRLGPGKGTQLIGGFERNEVSGRLRNYQVVSIRLRVNGKATNLPVKAISDLANVSRCSIKRKNGKVLFYIDGGDASTSYNAAFTLKDRKLVGRFVIDGESGEKITGRIPRRRK